MIYFFIILSPSDDERVYDVLVDYKEKLCQVSPENELILFLESDLSQMTSEEITASMNTYIEPFGVFFTSRGFEEFKENRTIMIYFQNEAVNTLSFVDLKIKSMTWNEAVDHVVVYYVLTLKINDQVLVEENNQAVLIKEKGKFKIDDETIFKRN